MTFKWSIFILPIIACTSDATGDGASVHETKCSGVLHFRAGGRLEGRRCTSRAAWAGNTASDTAGRTGEFAQGGQRIAEQDEVGFLSLTGGGEEVGGGWSQSHSGIRPSQSTVPCGLCSTMYIHILRMYVCMYVRVYTPMLVQCTCLYAQGSVYLTHMVSPWCRPPEGKASH